MTRKSRKNNKSKKHQQWQPVKQSKSKISLGSRFVKLLSVITILFPLLFAYLDLTPQCDIEFLNFLTENSINTPLNIKNTSLFSLNDVKLIFTPYDLLSSNNIIFSGLGTSVPVAGEIKRGQSVGVVRTSILGFPDMASIKSGKIVLSVSYKTFIPFYRFKNDFTYSAYLDPGGKVHWISK